MVQTSDYSTPVPTSMGSSVQAVAVRSAVDLLSSLASELPVQVFSGSGSTKRQITTPGYLLDPAGDGHGLPDWIYQVMISWLLRGNLYGDVLARSPSQFPTQVLPLNPDAVFGWLDGDGVVHWSVDGRPVENPASTFLHRRVNPMPGAVLGLSPISANAVQIGLNIASNRFGLQFFTDGAQPSAMLTNEEVELDGGQIKRAKEKFLAALRGTREPLVMGKGWKYQGLSIAPEEGQFLETNQWSAAECARIFGPGVAEILGYSSGSSMTYANVESRSIHLLVYTLHKWLRRVERLLTEMLPRPQFARLNRKALLESTTLQRFQVHEIALRNAIETVNEVRELEELEPVEWGDEPLVVQQMDQQAPPPAEDTPPPPEPAPATKGK
jgi:HK97 family phage portal protein